MELMTETEVRDVAGGGVDGLMDAGAFPQPVSYGAGGTRFWDRSAVKAWHVGRLEAAKASRATRERKEPGRQTREAP